MNNKLRLSALAFALSLAFAASPAAAQTKVGMLSCDVSAGIGLILVEKQSMVCTFTPLGGGTVTLYTGQIAEYGLALGAVEGGNLAWAVIALTDNSQPGALAGTYAGVGADVAAGLGLGADVLIGGTGRAFSLQPLAVEGEVGINIAGGVTSLTLAPAV